MPTFEEYKKIFAERAGTQTATATPQRGEKFNKYYKHFSQSTPTTQPTQQPFQKNFMSWLDRLMRLNYASAGLAQEIAQPGEAFEPGKEIWKGLTGEDKTLYSDVLKTVGWKPTTKIGKFARGVMGFGLDVLLDPLTYVGVGALTKTGRGFAKTGKLAASMGGQAKLGQRALLSFAGKPIIKGAPALGGLGKVGMAARKIPGVEKLGKAFVPGFRPKGVDANVWNKLLHIKRRATAIQKIGNEKAMHFATGILDDMKKLVNRGQLNQAGIDGLLNSIEKKSFSEALPNSLKPLWEKLIKYADEVGARREGIGKFLLEDTDIGYVLHTLATPEEIKVLRRTGMDVGIKDWLTSSASDIARKYINLNGKIVRMSFGQQKKLLKKGIKFRKATMEEIHQKLGKQVFSKDIPYIQYVTGRRIARQEAGTEFFKSIRELGFPDESLGLVKSTSPELKDLWFNPQIAKEIDKLKKPFLNDEVTQGFVKAFDNVQNYWKKWTLGPFPAYHFRNMVGNTWNNYLAGVTDPVSFKQATEIMWKRVRHKPLNAWEKEIIERAEALGVLERGWFMTTLGSGGAPKYYQKGRTLGKKVADIGLVPAELGLRFGRQVEDQARLWHFINKRKQGWAWDEAALSVKKYLFDYTELTPLEANVMRRLMPFYTWTRKNVPLQIEHIIKRPGKTVGVVEKARLGIAGGPEPERKYLPEWLKERAAFRVGKPEAGGIARYFPLESWLPIADVAKLGRPMQAITELTTPAIKLPTELLMNRSFYFDKPIERYKGEKKKMLGVPLSARQEYTARNIRLFNELNRFFQKPKPTAFEATQADKWLRILTGIKTYPQRISEMKRWARYNIDKQLFELKKGYNRAMRNKNYDEARRIQKTIKTLERLPVKE